jgi:predicted RNase H-like nuclease
MVWLCGVDGFKDEWCAVLKNLDTGEFVPLRLGPFAKLLAFPEHPAIVAVDVPIGLPEVTLSGGRSCDRRARECLRPRRASSVFSPLGRSLLTLSCRLEADRLSRANGGIGIGAQAWGLRKKLKEVDTVMTAAHQQTVHEVHPELSFQEMLGRPLDHGKKTVLGEHERVTALIGVGFPETFLRETPGPRVGRDDFLDACAALWTAGRIYRGIAKRIPDFPECDSRGLDMAIWF